HKYLKEFYLTGNVEGINIGNYEIKLKDNFEYLFGDHLLVNLWLHPDTSKARWSKVWDSMTTSYPLNYSVDLYSDNREHFFESSSQGGIYTEYGAYGGLEERMVKYFVLSDCFTDEKNFN
ncbi:hypothetical protein, partial [Zooshikella harenae]